ncbi:MAG TPA: 50S ribosomal protein L9 [Ignavibacteriaceae bacterium]|jgi:large subunit ribosomal protein L9|nr:MAG: 50S ribosomal protein L9 [Ignavibacteria bacterium ADurb.Bin266]OQY71600.1 MAG: 50S ribosomal protein L9 [Ignavibacteriales bacterium UTCHB2]HQF43139.1 50S ribosomal protein L9 [Ignavibacteriaceae bacterium]HQI41446.1 50S ribosomal protein L9 [Ignavibacteriaceae bacterium]HQJ46373.1 50S ribosomal protein L9 [Ignavibacteriaceae bacterium]
MKVILRQDFENLGKIGEIVDVKGGYARNFLFPRGIAYAALKGNIKALEEEKKTVEKRYQQELKAAEELAAKLEPVSITIPVQVGEEDKIFGTVTTQMIADALTEKGHNIDKRKIEIEEPIKALGIYGVSLKLHPNVSAKIKVWVVRE